MNNETLEVVENYKYLGLYLNEYMNFTIAKDVLAESGSRALGSIISKFKTFTNVTYNCFTKLYNSRVVPILDYASEIWGKTKAPSKGF